MVLLFHYMVIKGGSENIALLLCGELIYIISNLKQIKKTTSN